MKETPNKVTDKQVTEKDLMFELIIESSAHLQLTKH